LEQTLVSQRLDAFIGGLVFQDGKQRQRQYQDVERTENVQLFGATQMASLEFAVVALFRGKHINKIGRISG